MLALCESPAEEAFVRGWFEYADDHGWECCGRRAFEFTDPLNPSEGIQYRVIPQYQVGPFRLDFFFQPFPPRRDLFNGYAVEIDGHAWHERTHREAADQRRRDRRLLAEHRVHTVRFAAIEVLDDAPEVAAEIDQVVGEALLEWVEGKPLHRRPQGRRST